jgi:hypothetical protein
MPPRRLLAALTILLLLLASSSAWAETTYYVEVVLTDADTGNPAPSAKVLFSDDRGLGMRNPEAIEHGGKPGFYYASVPLYDNEKQISYRVTVTCQGYEERIHFLTITRGTPTTPGQILPLKLKRKLTKGQWIDVRVLRSDNSQPVVDAKVRVGPVSDDTDGGGNVKLNVTEPGPNQMHPLSVSHSAFYPFPPKDIPVKMYDEEQQQQYTCCLKPRGIIDAPESTCAKGQIAYCGSLAPTVKPRIVILVRDRGTRNAPADPGNRKPIPGAAVELTNRSGETKRGDTGTDGKVAFDVDPQKDGGAPLSVKVQKKDEYYDTTSFIPAGEIPTTATTLEWIVELDRLDVVKEKIDALTGKIRSTCGEIGSACTDLGNLFTIRESYTKEMDKLTQWIRDFGGKVETASRDCMTFPALRSEIQTLAGEVRTKAATVRTRLSAAEAKADVCRTKAEAQELKNLWQELITLSWEVHNSAKSAFEKQAVLKNIIARANAVKDRFDKADPSDRPVSESLAEVPNKFKDLQQAFKNQRDTVFTADFNAVKAKRKACTDTYNSAVQEIDRLHASTDSRVGQFKTTARGMIPAAGQPCDEESTKRSWDWLVDMLGQLVTSAADRARELKAKPLCAGESSADDLIAQMMTDQAVLSDLRASSIPQKIQQCEGQASGTPAPQPQPTIKVSISGPTVARVGDTVTLVGDPGGSQYRYDWDVDGKRSVSKTGNNTIRVPLVNETPKGTAHVFTLKVTEVRTGRYLGQATHRLQVDKAVPTNITLTLECPESAIPGTSVTCRARVDDGTLSSLGSMQYGAWGYWWYVDQKPMQTTNDTMSFTLPEKGAEVLVKLVKATTTSRNAQELKWTTKAIRPMPTGRSHTAH